MDYRVEWQGAPDDFAIVPSDPAPVDWGTSRLVRAESQSAPEGQSVIYSVEFVAERPGAYDVPAFKLAYAAGKDVFTAPVEFTPATTSHAAHAMGNEEPKAEEELATLPLEAGPIAVNVGYNISTELVAGVAAVALALAAAGVLVAMRVRGARARHQNPIPGATTVQGVLNLARQHRLDGKFYDYYRALARAATLAAPSVAARKLREKLEQDAQRVGYGALQPSDDDLEGALRDLERVLREPSAPRNEG